MILQIIIMIVILAALAVAILFDNREGRDEKAFPRKNKQI